MRQPRVLNPDENPEPPVEHNDLFVNRINGVTQKPSLGEAAGASRARRLRRPPAQTACRPLFLDHEVQAAVHPRDGYTAPLSDGVRCIFCHPDRSTAESGREDAPPTPPPRSGNSRLARLRCNPVPPTPINTFILLTLLLGRIPGPGLSFFFSTGMRSVAGGNGGIMEADAASPPQG
ncbi:hypothetical protein EYF80_052943 [Liparis tanakae]|uniref:Uncharacterized protein n=1 Tax=Liparis tanakae TaxID=230148 RepID=A0A4Z2F7Q3_9TELE|nr:hypothetical protein EYF80_052943 [Liparis tanakae]